jgi:hypothetical protein
MTPRTRANWDEEEGQFDQAWYDADENAATADAGGPDAAKFLGDAAKFAAKAAEYAKRLAQQQVKKISALQQARQEAANRWEEQQLVPFPFLFLLVGEIAGCFSNKN